MDDLLPRGGFIREEPGSPIPTRSSSATLFQESRNVEPETRSDGAASREGILDTGPLRPLDPLTYPWSHPPHIGSSRTTHIPGVAIGQSTPQSVDVQQELARAYAARDAAIAARDAAYTTRDEALITLQVREHELLDEQTRHDQLSQQLLTREQDHTTVVRERQALTQEVSRLEAELCSVMSALQSLPPPSATGTTAAGPESGRVSPLLDTSPIPPLGPVSVLAHVSDTGRSRRFRFEQPPSVGSASAGVMPLTGASAPTAAQASSALSQSSLGVHRATAAASVPATVVTQFAGLAASQGTFSAGFASPSVFPSTGLDGRRAFPGALMGPEPATPHIQYLSPPPVVPPLPTATRGIGYPLHPQAHMGGLGVGGVGDPLSLVGGALGATRLPHTASSVAAGSVVATSAMQFPQGPTPAALQSSVPGLDVEQARFVAALASALTPASRGPTSVTLSRLGRLRRSTSVEHCTEDGASFITWSQLITSELRGHGMADVLVGDPPPDLMSPEGQRWLQRDAVVFAAICRAVPTEIAESLSYLSGRTQSAREAYLQLQRLYFRVTPFTGIALHTQLTSFTLQPGEELHAVMARVENLRRMFTAFGVSLDEIQLCYTFLQALLRRSPSWASVVRQLPMDQRLWSWESIQTMLEAEDTMRRTYHVPGGPSPPLGHEQGVSRSSPGQSDTPRSRGSASQTTGTSDIEVQGTPEGLAPIRTRALPAPGRAALTEGETRSGRTPRRDGRASPRGSRASPRRSSRSSHSPRSPGPTTHPSTPHSALRSSGQGEPAPPGPPPPPSWRRPRMSSGVTCWYCDAPGHRWYERDRCPTQPEGWSPSADLIERVRSSMAARRGGRGGSSGAVSRAQTPPRSPRSPRLTWREPLREGPSGSGQSTPRRA